MAKFKKTFFVGIVMIISGIILSLQNYNPGMFGTVHEFTIQCHIKSSEFFNAYGDSYSELDWCLHNTGLSLILYAMLGAGGYLIYKSNIFKN